MNHKNKKLESEYQSKLKKVIKERFPGCLVTKQDSNDIQGIPDLAVFLPNGRWGMLEVKRSENAKHQPNQDYYIEVANHMSFAAFIYPENEEEVLNEMEQTLQS